MNPPGVKDVAARAGVSLGTVSNVLNRPDRVSLGTRERVERAIAELGFVRNESARQLRAGRSRMLAHLVLDAANPFFTDVSRGVEEAAAAAGLAVFLCNSAGDAGRERDYLDLMLEQRARGALVTPVGDEAALSAMRGRGLPMVLLDRAADTATWCSVSVDDVAGGELAVTHLVEQGHERIAFVGGPMATPQVADRRRGALQALAGGGLPGEALVVIETKDLTVAEGRRAAERLGGLPARRRPTAVFCANDLVALGLLQVTTRQGLGVPGDVAIIGYDDIEFAAAAAVPLTSVRQPRHLLGRTATELLLDEVESPDSHRHRNVQFVPELVVRASSLRTGKLRGRSEPR